MTEPMVEMTIEVSNGAAVADPFESRPPLQPRGAVNDGDAEAREDGREAETEDDDEQQAIADAVQPQRRQQYDDRGGARCDSAAHRGDDGAGEMHGPAPRILCGCG